MSIPDELDNARRLAYAADEAGARDLLLSLIPRIQREDRDDLMLEVLAQLGEIYLERGANDGVRECIRRIEDCVAIYASMPADAGTTHMIRRYSRRAQFLQTGLAAAIGDHEGAAAALAVLNDDADVPALADEHTRLRIHALVWCATALCDDDLHARSVPLWENVIGAMADYGGTGDVADHLRVVAGIGYGRFCVQTGRLPEADPWLRRAEARAQANGWELATAQARLERAAACWAANDHAGTEQLVSEAYPVIARHARAHDVARCWLYMGLTRLGAGALEAADECWEHAERHWRELGRPLHLHRILLQRSWIAIFWSRFAEAVELIAEARELLDSSPRSSWLQYALLDNHLGTVWRADALADLGFDSSGDPDETLQETEARQAEGLGILHGEIGTDEYWRGMTKLQQAAELKVPAALAVDSVRYSIADADARSRWAASISAPVLAGAFAVAWEWENTELISHLVEYHSARGTFGTGLQRPQTGEWASTATGGASLTRLGPLPPLRMQPDTEPILSHYRALAFQRYGRDVTATEPAWSTWP
ncbi:hypothetical protein [Mycobacterium sp. 852014-50255_SCH5639931]|uniref:hypothetical protein n=1 Tax=Mycobacterium sp. 852014-50255_SCH5639931 TaxID=1834112 RepID=UPI000800BA45|nr:hypothetical protein [Mycobacterium sp. 852014-50255_SCH5639931]OBB65230.1 hypothetical protein A5758_19035 [Mycobacterium sp. 852014-50255_SCH5639931]